MKMSMKTNNNHDEIKRIELESSINAAVRDTMTQRLVIRTEKGSLLNNLLLGRKKHTLNMFKVPVAYFERVGKGFKKKLKFIKLAESRLTRFFEANQVSEQKFRTIPLNNGEVIDATAEYTYSALVGNPIIFVEFVGLPMFPDPLQAAAYEECKDLIRNGLTWKYQGETIATEYAQSSASEMRTLKGVFVRENFKFSEEYLAKFKPTDSSDEEFEKFMEVMRSLRGAEVIYTAMSYGGYLTQYRGQKDSPAKFMARMGMSQTSTKSLGNDFRVKCIGEIKFPWTVEVEQAHRDFYTSLVDSNGVRLYSDKEVEKVIQKIKDLWKAEKEDGQNVIRASAVMRGFRKLGIKLSEHDVVGKLVQFRWAGVKGTALCVPDSWFMIAKLPDGTCPYDGYDVVVESSSWKFTPWMKYWNGELAPEFELVAVSKRKYTNNMNYQFVLALDGDGNRFIKTVEKLKGLVDSRYAFATEAMLNAEVAKAALGVRSTRENDLDDLLDIDDYERSLTTILAKALDACDDIIHDRSWRIKFVNHFSKMKDKMGYGKIPVEGANRFVISDPTAFFRTDLAVPRIGKDGKPQLDYEGNPMFDIVITSMDQVALRNIVGAYWANNEKEAVLFRSPCVHPGEPQRVTLVGLDSIPEKIETAYGELPTRELFKSIKDIVVVNCFSSILDCLGGADTDGDTVLVVTEPTIVELRSLRRPPMLTKVDAETFKTIINPESVKKYMTDSLEDAGIGRITNWSTTWRDIELMVVHMPNPVDGKYRLPKVVKDALLDAAKEARSALKINGDKMNEIEKASAEATAAIRDINVDEKFKEWAVLVINAAEANIALTRNLQEASINTAKSGIFVDFNKYPWLKLKIRASWHRPYAQEAYDSWSTMGQLSTYAESKWKELRKWAGETAKPIRIGEDLDWPSYREVYRTIRELKASFGTAMYELTRRNTDNGEEYESASERDKARMDAIKELGVYYNQILRRIAVEIGSVDAVSAMVYRATNDRDKDTDEGLSFVWQCWGEEFVHTLRHMNSGKASKRLVVVRMAKEYEDRTLPAGEYIVSEGGVRFPEYPDDVVAYAKVPDGTYEVITFDETPYILVNVVKKTVESMAANFKGVKMRLIGFKYHMYNGNVLTRNDVKELLAAANYVVTVHSGEKNGEFIDALVTVCLPDSDEPICIGNLPSGGAKNDESGYFAQALHNKVIRVLIPRSADKEDTNKKGEQNRLTLEIVEIIEDLSL